MFVCPDCGHVQLHPGSCPSDHTPLASRGDDIVFVEVKQARDLARAATRLSPAQQARLMAAAEVFLAGLPGAGVPRDCRFDVALVDGAGRVEIVPNAFA